MNQATKLSSRLAAIIEGGFFRPLVRPSAPIYIDCADRLAESADEDGQLSHNDTLVLIREVLSLHPSAQLGDDEGGHLTDLRQRAGQIFNKLLEVGWLQERIVSLDERWVLLTPRLRPLIRLLREFAEDSVAELKDFAATLRSICQTLLADGALDPARQTPEEFRQTIRELNDRVERAGEQMHAVESLTRLKIPAVAATATHSLKPIENQCLPTHLASARQVGALIHN
ncbi:MAG TPA: Wadjet anti-phage system protein JetA family protein [Verrucomicrobiae bacterium]|nr:Wadjet anti-phage system protein JetA family protein [Verrucomicrobiae bacterium]